MLHPAIADYIDRGCSKGDLGMAIVPVEGVKMEINKIYLGYAGIGQ